MDAMRQHPTDEVIDLIGSIEMHRQELERDSGLEASRSYALARLQQALAAEPLPENAAALAEAIKRLQARAADPLPAGRRRRNSPPQPRTARGRRAPGRRSAR